ncbi:MAG: hypothetical protein ISS82_02010 [Nanoarchaeota archaeon]|nr:hypothetical protein [Nanoarchaeota archaeon]
MAKCNICKKQIKETFLNKLIGTYVKVNKKKKIVCNDCQRKYSQKEILEKLK